jgi:hypothetical protein
MQDPDELAVMTYVSFFRQNDQVWFLWAISNGFTRLLTFIVSSSIHLKNKSRDAKRKRKKLPLQPPRDALLSESMFIYIEIVLIPLFQSWGSWRRPLSYCVWNWGIVQLFDEGWERRNILPSWHNLHWDFGTFFHQNLREIWEQTRWKLHWNLYSHSGWWVMSISFLIIDNNNDFR